MDILLINVLVFVLIGLSVAAYRFVYQPVIALTKKVESLQNTLNKLIRTQAQQVAHVQKLHKRIDDIFVVTPDKRVPNEAMKLDEDVIELDENNPLDLPEDVKITVEGGDSEVPPHMTNG